MTPDLDKPLAAFAGERPPAPTWYDNARGTPIERLHVDVQGAVIEVLAWGEPGLPGLLLVHGARAHAHWWIAVAPLLARDYRVASVSLSGMGGSDWRDRYDSEDQVEELFAAARVAGLHDGPRSPIIVGHSFGARVASLAAGWRGDELAGAILVDTSVAPEEIVMAAGKPPRSWPDLRSILARFRLAPPERCDHASILDDVARAGVLEDEDGRWRWRFDPSFLDKLRYESGWDKIASPRCPLAFIHGERSEIVTAEKIAAQIRQAPLGTPFVVVPDAGHHIMLSQPIALAATIRSILAVWDGADAAHLTWDLSTGETT